MAVLCWICSVVKVIWSWFDNVKPWFWALLEEIQIRLWSVASLARFLGTCEDMMFCVARGLSLLAGGSRVSDPQPCQLWGCLACCFLLPFLGPRCWCSYACSSALSGRLATPWPQLLFGRGSLFFRALPYAWLFGFLELWFVSWTRLWWTLSPRHHRPPHAMAWKLSKE